MPIKIILVAGLAALAVLGTAVTRNRTATRLLLLLQLLAGVVLVLFPGVTQWAAELVGVGRGTDLLLYLLALGVYFAAIVAVGKARRLERRITALVRESALLRERLERLEGKAECADGGAADDNAAGGQGDGGE